MTVQTSTRKPAAAILQNLAKDHRIRFFQAGDNDQLCAGCMIPILPTRTGWVHDPEAIRRLRAATYDGRWPNGG